MSVFALVLAAGESKRMGTCKQLLELGGKPLVQRIVDGLEASELDGIIVVLGAHADEILRKIDFKGARIVINPEFHEGISTSLKKGLEVIPRNSDYILIVLADQPLVSREIIGRLVAALESSDKKIAVPTYRSMRGNPVMFHRSVLSEVSEITGDVGAKRLIQKHVKDVAEVEVKAPYILMDMDTPQDYCSIRKLLEEKKVEI